MTFVFKTDKLYYMKKSKLFLATIIAGFSSLSVAQAQTARLEIIHNAADDIASVVDVYVNAGAAPFIDNFAFRTTSGFIDVPAGVDLNIGIALSTSTGPSDILFTLPAVNLIEDETYIAIANGIVSASGYMPNSIMAPFGLDVYSGAREAAVGGAGTNDVLVHHGATDAPMVDVDELNVVMSEAVNDLSYSEFQGYLALGVDNYTLQVQAASSGGAVAAFNAPLAGLGIDGAALTVLASGFLEPSVNSDGPAFGLWVSSGVAGPLLELPSPEARIEIIHNSSDAAAAVVDVFVNGTEAVPDFAYRTTTGFLTLPAGMPLSIEVAPDGAGLAGALPAIEIPFLASGATYIAVANGIVSGSGYMPSSMDAPFGLHIYDEAREQAANQGMSETDVLVYHGSTDAPMVDVFESGAVSATIVEDISYSEFSADGYLELGTSNYQLTIQDETGAVNVASFDAPLQTLMLEDAAITVLASGFLNPTANSGGPMFGLWVSLGTGGDLIPLSNVTGVNEVEVINNASLFPNPTNDNSTMFFDLQDETNIKLEVINTMGQCVVIKSLGQMASGNHRVEIPTSQMATGFYFVNLTTDSGVVSTKMQVVR
ncbi:MAG: hypothetical protein ACI9UR_001778 [Bacteroidia bacterium]